MRVLVQWARSTPGGWRETTSETWGSLPKRPVPVGGETIDSGPGWVEAVCVQGVVFEGHDHYAVEQDGGICRVTVWSDDPGDHDPSGFWAEVWEFRPVAFDPRVGEENTRQTLTIFAAPAARERLSPPPVLTGGTAEIKGWEEFTPPAEPLVRHGIWLSDELFGQLQATRRRPTWMEWADG